MKGWTKTESVKDGVFLDPIRKLSGFEQKIEEDGLLYCKSAVSKQLPRLRGGHALVKACKAFEQKIASAEVAPKHRQAMATAVDMFQVNAGCKDITLTWCIASLTHMAKYEFSFSDPGGHVQANNELTVFVYKKM